MSDFSDYASAVAERGRSAMSHKIVFGECGLLGVEAICSCGWSERTTDPFLGDEVWRRSRLHLQPMDALIEENSK